MRGYPLLQLLLVVCLFAAAGFPVWRSTRPAAAPVLPAPSATPTPAASGETTLVVSLAFAPAPSEFRLICLDQTLFEGHGPQAEFQGTARVALPPEGTDFALEAHFTGALSAAATTPPPSPVAVRVRCQFPDGHTMEKTIWSEDDRPLVELITVTP